MNESAPRSVRAAMALVLGLFYGVGTAAETARSAAGSDAIIDFQYWWAAAWALLAGLDPYAVIGVDGPFPFPSAFVYPLPAALVTTPLAGLAAYPAAGAFTGVGVALAAYALSARGLGALWLFASAPAIMLFRTAQWAPLMLAAALLPGIGGLLVCKPTLGLALATYRPRWSIAVGGLVLILAAFVVQPGWLGDWLAAVARDRQGAQYVPPVLVGPGALCLLALLRWRRPEARLLAALACIPQNYFFYDQLYLGLVLRSHWQFVVAALWSHAVLAVAAAGELPAGAQQVLSAHYAPVVVIGLYLPALLLVLLRPNEGFLPAAIERRLAPLPPWLRGRSSSPA